MTHPRSRAAPLFAAAAAGYAANCALGTAAATRLVDTSGWAHHLLYVATCVTTAAALGTAWRGGSADRRAALMLAPAAVPLTAIAFLGPRSPRHPLVALAAAPFIVAGFVRSRLPDRK